MERLFTRLLFVLLVMLFVSCSKDNTSSQNVTPPVVNPPASQTWKFESSPLWEDEFSTDGLPDETKWSYDIGGNGWGNGEAQYYTNGENVKIESGFFKKLQHATIPLIIMRTPPRGLSLKTKQSGFMAALK